MHWARSSLRWLYAKTYYYRPVARARLLLQVCERDFQRSRRAGVEDLFASDLGPRTVLGGLFRGLRYPRDMTLGAAYYPKLVGTYEMEVYPFLEGLLGRRDYTTIVDVGSAEGYYAVGLAMRCPRARVYAYDIDPMAQGLLAELATANGVSERIEFAPECTREELICRAAQSPRGLLVSDCEGYELELLQPAVLDALRGWDLLVETHDSLEQDITSQLTRRIAVTHWPRLVRWRRRRLADYPIAGGSNPLGCLAAMDEGRTWRNKWLCCEPLAEDARQASAQTA